jgi:hypothetical protein
MNLPSTQKAQRRFKHTGSFLPDFVFTEHYDDENKILTIAADDFDSLALADLVVRNDQGIVAFEDETKSRTFPLWSVIVEISGLRFRARIVRQRRYGALGGEQITVRLTSI